ncbi:RNA polymerase sigma factor [Terriglobus sp. YAF25]|uniref:RNA polymerase sigma factor n=1 Tax=Terriglobus sp. YAF25 TaxID=3233080 RepID=UPI003F9BF720
MATGTTNGLKNACICCTSLCSAGVRLQVAEKVSGDEVKLSATISVLPPLQTYRALPTFRGEAMLSTYLYRITVNVAQDEWKRRRRVDDPLLPMSTGEEDGGPTLEDRLAHRDPGAEQQLLSGEFWSMVQQQVMTLTPVERTVLTLFHQEEQTYEQIALTLNLPINTVRTHLHRARTRLKQRVEQAMKPEAVKPAVTIHERVRV